MTTPPRPLRRAFFITLLALITALAGAPTFAGAAQPSTVEWGPMSSSQCASGRFCLWSGAIYTGNFFNTTASADVSGMAVAASVWNRTSKAVRVYSSAGGGGSSTCFAPGAQVASTSLAARSVRISTTTTC